MIPEDFSALSSKINGTVFSSHAVNRELIHGVFPLIIFHFNSLRVYEFCRRHRKILVFCFWSLRNKFLVEWVFQEPFNTGSFLSIIVENPLSFSSHFRANFAMKSSRKNDSNCLSPASYYKELKYFKFFTFWFIIAFYGSLFFTCIAEPMFVTSLNLL